VSGDPASRQCSGLDVRVKDDPKVPVRRDPLTQAPLDRAMVPRVSVNWQSLKRWPTVLLPLIFVPLAAADVVASVVREWLGSDAHLYYQASAAWLAGGNPWDVSVQHSGLVFHYYALPTAVLALAPFTAAPEAVFVPFWVGVQAASAVFVVRRLRLTWWWLAFPPLVKGVLVGNPSLVVLALALAAHPVLNAVAPVLKVYMGIALFGERRWRGIALALGLGVATLVLTPGLWGDFFAGAAARNDRLLIEANGGYSGFRHPVLFAGAALALLAIARRDLRVACWLAPIALWPGSQFHWSTLAMPVMTTPLAYLLALPAHGLPPIAVMVYAAIAEVMSIRRKRGESSGRAEIRGP